MAQSDSSRQQPEGSGQTTKVAEQIRDAVEDAVERSKQLLETASSYTSKLRQEGDALGSKAAALEKETKALRAEVIAAAEKDELTSVQADELLDKLSRARSAVYEGDVAALLPHKAYGAFLELFLGNVNVVSARREGRHKVKEEYNTFRDRTALVFLSFPLLLLGLKHEYAKQGQCVPGLPVTAYSAWLLFFYTSLALRENILRINGSDIRPWWIYHHYFAMFMALVSLTWGIEGPDCLQKQDSVSLFLWWAVMQGVVMLVQNRYQRRRMYTRIALGKAGRMDVVWGESAGVKGQLWILYPLLFALQGFQFYIGVLLGQHALFKSFEWQIATCGGLLIIMALGNFINTLATLATKARFKAKMKRKLQQTQQFGRSLSGLKSH